MCWPAAAAMVALGVALALQWRWHHGGAATEQEVEWWKTAFGFLLTGWVYALLAAAVLARTRLTYAVRLGLASLFPVVLWGALSLTPEEGGFLKFDMADVFFLLPAVGFAAVAPDPQFTSACDVSYWAARSRGFDPTVRAMYELGDRSVLVVGSLQRGARETDHGKLARLDAAGRPDPRFRLDRKCMRVEDVVPGPGGTFSVKWEARPAASRGEAVWRVAWRDSTGRPLPAAPFPAPAGAITQRSRDQLSRPTPAGGLTLVADLPATDPAGQTVARSFGLVRVLPDGRYDPGFTPWPVPAGNPGAEVRDIHDVRDGGLLLLVRHILGDSARLIRLGPDGRPNATFTDRAAAALAPYAPARTLTMDAAGRVLVGFGAQSPVYDSAGVARPTARARSVVRLRPDGSLDPAFRSDSAAGGEVKQLAPQPTGHTIVEYATSRPVASRRGSARLFRLDSMGREDAGFGARIAGLEADGINQVLVRRDGALVVDTWGAGLMLLAPDASAVTNVNADARGRGRRAVRSRSGPYRTRSRPSRPAPSRGRPPIVPAP